MTAGSWRCGILGTANRMSIAMNRPAVIYVTTQTSWLISKCQRWPRMDAHVICGCAWLDKQVAGLLPSAPTRKLDPASTFNPHEFWCLESITQSIRLHSLASIHLPLIPGLTLHRHERDRSAVTTLSSIRSGTRRPGSTFQPTGL